MSVLLFFPPPSGTPTTAPAVSTADWTGPLRILGAAQLGKTLSVDITNLPAGSYSYQWLRASLPAAGKTPSWSAIGGATGATYTLVAADVGKIVTAVLT